MADDRSIRSVQVEILRQATDTARGGVPRKVLAAQLGLSESTLRSYIEGTHVLGLGTFVELVAVRPDLAGLMLPDGFAAVRLPDGMDHAGAALAAADFLASYAQARMPDSEAGVEIGPREAEALGPKVAAIGAGALRQPVDERGAA